MRQCSTFRILFCFLAILFVAGGLLARPALAQDDSTATQDTATTPDSGSEDSKTQTDTSSDDATSASAPESDSGDQANPEQPRNLVQKFNDALEPVNDLFGDMNGHIESVVFCPIPLAPQPEKPKDDTDDAVEDETNSGDSEPEPEEE